jgi:hypothetical protein
MVPGAKAPAGMTLFVDTVWPALGGCLIFCAGAPCRDKEKAFILAAMSEVSSLARKGTGPGRRAALTCPRGAEEGVMVFGNDPSSGVRSEGGFGGEVQSCGGRDVGGYLGASSRGLSASEG